jgi:hypothetical protein
VISERSRRWRGVGRAKSLDASGCWPRWMRRFVAAAGRLIEPYYSKAARGRQPPGLQKMLRI